MRARSNQELFVDEFQEVKCPAAAWQRRDGKTGNLCQRGRKAVGWRSASEKWMACYRGDAGWGIWPAGRLFSVARAKHLAT
jgi:hypothetical protein